MCVYVCVCICIYMLWIWVIEKFIIYVLKDLKMREEDNRKKFSVLIEHTCL